MVESYKTCLSYVTAQPFLRTTAFAIFDSEVITSYSSNWIMPLFMLLCTSAPLVLCCGQFDRGSRQVKRDPVDLGPIS